MVGYLLALVICLTYGADSVEYVMVRGVLKGKKLTIYGTDGDLQVERIGVRVEYRGDTMIVDIDGERGVMIGGAGALLGLPPRLTKLNISSTASNIFFDLKKLRFSSIFVQSTGSKITFFDRYSPVSLCDSLLIVSSFSRIEFIGAGAREAGVVILDFKSTVSRFNFFDTRWKRIYFSSKFGRHFFSGLFPGIVIKGILNFTKGEKEGYNMDPIRFSGTLNWIRIDLR